MSQEREPTQSEDPYRSDPQEKAAPAASRPRFIIDLSEPGRPEHLLLKPRDRWWSRILSLLVPFLALSVLTPIFKGVSALSVFVEIGALAVIAYCTYALFGVEEIRITEQDLVRRSCLWGVGLTRRIPLLAIEEIEIGPKWLQSSRGPGLLDRRWFGDVRLHLEVRLWRRDRPFLLAVPCWYERDDLEWLRTYLLTAIGSARAARDVRDAAAPNHRET